jgi:hypothetical protein
MSQLSLEVVDEVAELIVADADLAACDRLPTMGVCPSFNLCKSRIA